MQFNSRKWDGETSAEYEMHSVLNEKEMDDDVFMTTYLHSPKLGCSKSNFVSNLPYVSLHGMISFLCSFSDLTNLI